MWCSACDSSAALTSWLTFALYLLLPISRAQCPGHGSRSPLLDDKVEGSDTVIQGHVVRQVKVNNMEASFGAEVRVECVYKGGPVGSAITVYRADTVEWRCVETELQAGQTYLLYLQKTGDRYTQAFIQDPAQSKYLQELEYVCGLDVQLPEGVTGRDTAQCQPSKFGVEYLADCPVSETHNPSSLAPSLHRTLSKPLFWSVLSSILIIGLRAANVLA